VKDEKPFWSQPVNERSARPADVSIKIIDEKEVEDKVSLSFVTDAAPK
jgi:hypothetical protein